MFNYVIFDFDGTLVDSKDIFIYVYNQLAESHNFKKIQDKDVEKFRKLSVFERAKLLNVPMYLLPFLATEFYNLYKEQIKNLKLFDGIKEVLEKLKDKKREIIIISSNSESNIREFLEKNQIDVIDEIFCSNNILGKDKIINKFLKKHYLRNWEVIYVGDEIRDIVACKKTGIEVVWVEWGCDLIDNVKEYNPNYIVSTPSDILRIVE